MTAVLQGVRVLEVAEHTFVPAASALLSDWGAEVIKIEHVERGDAMRGLASTGLALVPSDVHALLEHSNRGKRSLGLDLTSPDGLDILYKLAGTSDVFLTNKLPSVRRKLKIGVDEVRAHNPDIIYVRGTGQGERGPDADKGSYDSLAFWARSGVAVGAKRPEYDLTPVPPAPGFGDSIGAMTIAGGILGALFHRERTGEATIVDVSLLGVGLWAMGQAVALSLVLGQPWTPPRDDRIPSESARRATTRPRTAGSSPSPASSRASTGPSSVRPSVVRSWPPTSVSPTTPRCMANSAEAIGILTDVFASATLGEWRGRLGTSAGSGPSCRTPWRRWTIPDRRQRLRPGVPHGDGDALPAGGRAGPVRRGTRGTDPRPGSTSTATPSSPTWASTPTPSSTSRSVASSPDCRPRRSHPGGRGVTATVGMPALAPHWSTVSTTRTSSSTSTSEPLR